jgi:hypothetical protein
VDVYLDRAIEEILAGDVLNNYPENYTISIHHSPEKSTFTILHTVPEPRDYPNPLWSSA